ncbi:hypothetical protein PQ478_09430 [Alkalihalophilus pseudofirmus]|uniref:hypothetical protein n=1 Tax=Alkalihalophilus pseudofirmus TaxID=79885 RepID=UPI00259B37C5|nr:hypothetical protein [Alkalihalophilus pseudofirmus]WEG18689.1 hypothetical protein PQ478_09430 [Alkalihalophilus pseudofirmus]
MKIKNEFKTARQNTQKLINACNQELHEANAEDRLVLEAMSDFCWTMDKAFSDTRKAFEHAESRLNKIKFQ